jgi:hypothetical protein
VIIPPILICERRLGDPRVTFIPTQSIYERAPDAFTIHSSTLTGNLNEHPIQCTSVPKLARMFKCSRKKYGKKFSDKKSIILLLLLTVIQCKQRYTRTSFITLQCYRSGFKIFFLISKASKFSIMQDIGSD